MNNENKSIIILDESNPLLNKDNPMLVNCKNILKKSFEVGNDYFDAINRLNIDKKESKKGLSYLFSTEINKIILMFQYFKSLEYLNDSVVSDLEKIQRDNICNIASELEQLINKSFIKKKNRIKNLECILPTE